MTKRKLKKLNQDLWFPGDDLFDSELGQSIIEHFQAVIQEQVEAAITDFATKDQYFVFGDADDRQNPHLLMTYSGGNFEGLFMKLDITAAAEELMRDCRLGYKDKESLVEIGNQLIELGQRLASTTDLATSPAPSP